ncbi:MAG TPA: hypothetical protein VMW86_00615 [Dehalococcoidales bacterium]|nr:hypothetical protein [Dehalococcoidales bacterium]
MKKKLVFLSFILSLLAFCLTYGEGVGAARDQEIQSEVIEPSPLPIWRDNISSSENVISSNQTFEMKNPTFEEVRDFILKDPTSRKIFVLNKYECRHFATDVNNNAEAVGIRCAFVLLCYRNGQHAVVAFDTTDRGLIYIEPQTDVSIEPEVGGKYQGEEIIEILISW